MMDSNFCLIMATMKCVVWLMMAMHSGFLGGDEMDFKVSDLLSDVKPGGIQSVGVMEVIPLLKHGTSIPDDLFGTPENLEIGTVEYGTVRVKNKTSKPVLIPSCCSWVTKEEAQDHAMGRARFVDGHSNDKFNDAVCIQSSQCGLMELAEREHLILPVGLRARMLSHDRGGSFKRMWEPLGEFNNGYSIGSDQSLVHFLNSFEIQLNQFVAEFERVPGQVGAIVLICGKIVGIELTPNCDYWASVWNPLIRVSYGSLAIKCARAWQNRDPLRIEGKSLKDIHKALLRTKQVEIERSDTIFEMLKQSVFDLSSKVYRGRRYDNLSVYAIASSKLTGDIVIREKSKVSPYISVCSIL